MLFQLFLHNYFNYFFLLFFLGPRCCGTTAYILSSNNDTAIVSINMSHSWLGCHIIFYIIFQPEEENTKYFNIVLWNRNKKKKTLHISKIYSKSISWKTAVQSRLSDNPMTKMLHFSTLAIKLSSSQCFCFVLFCFVCFFCFQH